MYSAPPDDFWSNEACKQINLVGRKLPRFDALAFEFFARSQQYFPTQDQLESAGRFEFFSTDPLHPLCRQCVSLKFADLYSTKGVMLQPQPTSRHPAIDACTLCDALRKALKLNLEEEYSQLEAKLNFEHFLTLTAPDWDPFSNTVEDKFERRDARLLALESEPVMLFFNPLRPNPDGREYGIIPYQIRELTAWSSVPDILEKIEISPGKWDKDYSYRRPTLNSGLNPGTDEEQKLKLALATSTFIPKTSWSDPLAKLIRHKSVTRAMNSPESLSMIKGWVDDCAAAHQSCRTSSCDELPTRLIDVGDETSRRPRLVLTNSYEQCGGKESKDNRYIALSYCWGSHTVTGNVLEFATTSETLNAHLLALPTMKLPKTILHTIDLARSLGVRFIWADILCIVQGPSPEAQKDWERESSKMADVYGGAWLTIAASWGNSMHEGLFTERPTDISDSVEVGLRSFDDADCEGIVKLVPAHPRPVDSMEEPLYQRGWALQERILSRRILICNRDQFVWECQDTCFTESGFLMESIGAMRLDQAFHTNLKTDRNTFRNTWQSIVTDYSHRHLTKPSDKLPAISGLAKQFQNLFPEEVYLAGMWKSTFLDDLLWVHRTDDWEDETTLGNLNVRRQSRLPKRVKPAGYRAPSWSWASVDGGVRWLFTLRNALQRYHAQLLDYRVTPRTNDCFGQLTDAYITLKAPLWRIPRQFYSEILEDCVWTSRDNASTASKDVNDSSKGQLTIQSLDPSIDVDKSTQSGPGKSNVWWRGSSLIKDVHLDGRSLAHAIGHRIENTELFLLSIKDDIQLLLSSPKLKEEDAEPPDGFTRCYERIGIHVMGFLQAEDEVIPEWKITICRLI